VGKAVVRFCADIFSARNATSIHRVTWWRLLTTLHSRQCMLSAVKICLLIARYISDLISCVIFYTYCVLKVTSISVDFAILAWMSFSTV